MADLESKSYISKEQRHESEQGKAVMTGIGLKKMHVSQGAPQAVLSSSHMRTHLKPF